MSDDIRAKLAEALSGHQRNPYGQHDGWWECRCSPDEPHTPEHLVDVLLSLKGVAIVALPERAPIPSHWNSDCLGGWLADPGDYPVSAWPNAEIALADGTWMSAARARALATALLAATDVAEVATS